MANTGCFFTFYTLTPLHAGAGEGSAAVDLAIQREKHTEFPVVNSSSMKGSLRSYFRNNKLSNEDEIFGTLSKQGEDSSNGKVVFTDAKILLFPVRSSEGVFKWVTCPFVLNRLSRDWKFLNQKEEKELFDKEQSKNLQNVTEKQAFTNEENRKYPVVLEDFAVEASSNNSLSKFVEFIKGYSHIDEQTVKSRLLLVHDDVFKLLVKYGTQVIARNVLDPETKISKNLWYEEVVPADALFYTIMMPVYNDTQSITQLTTAVGTETLQIGGNETIGYGFVKMKGNEV